jgi:formate dehydrogenase major subunit
MFAGVTYERLEGYKTLQWPVAIDGTDEPLLYTTGFHNPDNKAQFHPLEYRPPSEPEDEEYEFHLNNGRLLEHFHEGNMTYRVPGIHQETPERWVEVSPEAAARCKVKTGQWVDIISRRGKVRTQVLITDRVRGNQMYIPLNSPQDPVNVLTGNQVDPDTHTPAYKELAVKMKPLPWQGENPLRPLNFRNGHRTPQNGVEVERKWKQAGYRMPGLAPAPASELVQINTRK